MFIAENVIDKQLTLNESESKMRTGINKVFKSEGNERENSRRPMTMPVLDGPMTMPVLDGVKPVTLPVCGTSDPD